MAEAEPTKPLNVADLVPFADPDPVPRISRRQAAKELGVELKDEEFKEMFDGFAQLRAGIDSIPTPGRDEGDLMGEFSLFSLVKDTLSSALSLVEAPVRGQITPEQVFKDTLDLMPGTMGVASRGPAGAVGIFGSRPGIYAAPEVHQKFSHLHTLAEEMDQVGSNADDIWKATGMSKDHEGKWRYEIDNSDAVVDYEVLDRLAMGEEDSVMLGDIIKLPKVYEHWPELQDVPVENMGGEFLGGYHPNLGIIKINLNKVFSPEAPHGAEIVTLIHEAQHALQYSQGRLGGTSPGIRAEEVEFAFFSAARAIKLAEESQAGGLSPFQRAAQHKIGLLAKNYRELMEKFGKHRAAYLADPGEIEARLAEKQFLNPSDISMHPDDLKRRLSTGVDLPLPTARQQFTPDDIRFPSPTIEEQLAASQSGRRPFGTRPVESASATDAPAPRPREEIDKEMAEAMTHRDEMEDNFVKVQGELMKFNRTPSADLNLEDAARMADLINEMRIYRDTREMMDQHWLRLRDERDSRIFEEMGLER